MVLAAGEVLHGRAEAFGLERAHIHLQAFAAHFRATTALFSPHGPSTSSTRGIRDEPLKQHIGRGAGPVTNKSRSPAVSRPRRRLPGRRDRHSTPGTCRKVSINSSAMPST